MASTKVSLGAAQYSVTRSGKLTEKWEIKNQETGDSRWIRFPLIGPSMLLDEQQEPMGKISSDKLFAKKKNISINMRDCHVHVLWKAINTDFHLEGSTDVKGYETIDWKWKREGEEMKFSLENKENESVIAEFRKNLYRQKDVGEICIYKTLPENINWFIVFSACYSLIHVQSINMEMAANI